MQSFKIWLHILAQVCNGIGGSYEDVFQECCGTKNPCDVNQGDCDSDSECKDGLACGRDNCPSPFPSDADCCEQGNLTTSTRPQVRPSLFFLNKTEKTFSLKSLRNGDWHENCLHGNW